MKICYITGLNENISYHGWKNWDTWNCHLWLSNTESSCLAMCEAATTEKATAAFRFLAEHEMEILGNPDSVDYTKVDWAEVHAAFSE